MSLAPPHTEHISVSKVTINLKFPCRVFLVVTVSSQSKELTKIQTRSVELSNNEAIFEQSLSVDITDSRRRPLEIQYTLYIETKNGVKMAGKATDTLHPEQPRSERTLQFEKCPDRQASLRVAYHCDEHLDRSKVTTIAVDYAQQNRVKALVGEKAKLESQLSLSELQNYEKDIVIKNLSLELRLKAEENKYLFSAEKLKEVSSGYQQEIRELKRRVGQLEAENRGIKRELDQAKKEIQAANRHRQEARSHHFVAFGKALQRMSRCIDIPAGFESLDTPKTSQESQQQPEDMEHIGDVFARRLSAFERSINAFKIRYTENAGRTADLEKHYRQSQQLVKQLGSQLQRKQKSQSQSQKLIEQLRLQISTLTRSLEGQDRAETQQLKKAKSENLELTSTIASLKRQVAELQAACHKQAEAQTKLKELMREQEIANEEKIGKFVAELEKWKGVEIQSSNAYAEKNRNLQEELRQARETIGCLEVEKLCLEEERKQASLQLRKLQEEVQDLQAKLKESEQNFADACARSKNSLREVSNANISIAESYSRLRIESEYRLNEQKAEKALLRIELDQIKSRYEADIQELKRKLQELGSIEKETINLCQKLGYSEPDENDLSAFVCDSETKMPKAQEDANRLKKEYDRLQNSLSDVAWQSNPL